MEIAPKRNGERTLLNKKSKRGGEVEPVIIISQTSHQSQTTSCNSSSCIEFVVCLLTLCLWPSCGNYNRSGSKGLISPIAYQPYVSICIHSVVVWIEPVTCKRKWKLLAHRETNINLQLPHSQGGWDMSLFDLNTWFTFLVEIFMNTFLCTVFLKFFTSILRLALKRIYRYKENITIVSTNENSQFAS